MKRVENTLNFNRFPPPPRSDSVLTIFENGPRAGRKVLEVGKKGGHRIIEAGKMYPRPKFYCLHCSVP